MLSSHITYRKNDDGNDIAYEKKVQQWYHALDSNGDGHIDMMEYFVFALRESIFRTEAKLPDISEGRMLSLLLSHDQADLKDQAYMARGHFTRLAHQLGFPKELGAQMFDDVLEEARLALPTSVLDADGDEARVEATQFLMMLHQRTELSRGLALSWGKSSIRDSLKKPSMNDIQLLRDSRKNVLAECVAEKDSEGVLRALQSWIVDECKLSPLDFFVKVDGNENSRISLSEWKQLMAEIEFEAPEEMLTTLFDELATSGAYHLSFYEVRDWLEGGGERSRRASTHGGGGDHHAGS